PLLSPLSLLRRPVSACLPALRLRAPLRSSSARRSVLSDRFMASRAFTWSPRSSARSPWAAVWAASDVCLRPICSISSSSSRTFWGGTWSGRRPSAVRALVCSSIILYSLWVKSDRRSGSASICSSSLSRSSPFLRKLLKSGRWPPSAVSLKSAGRSPALTRLAEARSRSRSESGPTLVGSGVASVCSPSSRVPLRHGEPAADRPGWRRGEAPERARRGAERDESDGARRRRRADQALGEERHDRGHGPVERPLEPVELEAAPAHLSRDSPDQTVETGG